MSKRKTTESEDELKVKDRKEVTQWLDEIAKAEKREVSWRGHAKEAIQIYEGGKAADNPFNILYSNTETLTPALYNVTPKPEAVRRFRDPDPIGLDCAKIINRVSAFVLDDNSQKYDTFNQLLEQAVLGAAVPGRGQIWLKYDPDLTSVVKAKKKPTDKDEYEDKVGDESVCGEPVEWDRFVHGYGRTWKQVPWVARRHEMDRDELVKTFGEVGREVEMLDTTTDEKDSISVAGGQDNKKLPAMAIVWEIWSKRTRRVYFVSPQYVEAVLKSVDDPLKLSNFFPCPQPLTLFKRVSSLCPQVLYEMYKQQALELNEITIRIKAVVKQIRVRGAYDGASSDLAKVLEAGDGVMLPIRNAASLGNGGQVDLDKAIWLVPLGELVSVLQQLYTQREQIKSIIYEITGISDILRGSTMASETATAQTIKDKWGTLRLKRMQKEVSRFARDVVRIIAEIAVNHLSTEKIASMCGQELFPTLAQQNKAKQEIHAMTQAAAAHAQQQQAMVAGGQNGLSAPSQAGPGGPQPPQVGPGIPQGQSQGQPTPAGPPSTPPSLPPFQPPPALMAISTGPTWESLHKVLQDKLMVEYKIDIELNSTLDAEATEDKEEIGALMNAIAQFLNGVAPAVEQGILPFEAAKSILLAIVRRYSFGEEAEQALQQMSAPPPKQDPKMMEAQAQLQEKGLQQQQQAMQDKMNLQEQTLTSQAELKRQSQELQFQRAEFDLQKKVYDAQKQADEMIRNAQMQADQAIEQAGKVVADAELKSHLAEQHSALDIKRKQITAAQSQSRTRSKEKA